MQFRGARHQEPGQQLRLWPTALSVDLAVLPNPRGPGPGEVPLDEGVLPPLQVCTCPRNFSARTRPHRTISAREEKGSAINEMIEDLYEVIQR